MVETFVCPVCGAESANPFDRLEGYCGACHDWTRGDRLDAYRSRYYDIDGERIPMRRWTELFEERATTGYGMIARTAVRPGVEVSTVWLGLDHGHHPDGPPEIFETMVFGGPLDQDGMERYATLEAACAGHERWVMAARDDNEDGG